MFRVISTHGPMCPRSLSNPSKEHLEVEKAICLAWDLAEKEEDGNPVNSDWQNEFPSSRLYHYVAADFDVDPKTNQFYQRYVRWWRCSICGFVAPIDVSKPIHAL